MHVVVAGGGIAGLCLTRSLSLQGVQVTLLEQASELTEVGAGITLWPNATRALAELGGLEALAPHVQQRAPSSVFNHRGQRLADIDVAAYERRFGAPLIAIHRARLVESLGALVPREAVRLGARLARFEEDGRKVITLLEDGSSVEGDILVGADGIHSRVRAELDPRAAPRYSGRSAFRGIARMDAAGLAPDAPVWGMYVGGGREIGLVPLAHGEIYWFVTHTTRAGEPDGAISGAPAGSDGAFPGSEVRKRDVLHALRRWPEVVRRVVEATPASGVLRTDLYDLGPLTCWSRGRVTLMGDAAHATTPHLGMGAAMAIEDAVVLGDLLGAGGDLAEALARYEGLRRARTERLVAESRRMGRFVHQPNAVVAWLRDVAIRLAPPSLRMNQLAWLLDYDARAHLREPKLMAA